MEDGGSQLVEVEFVRLLKKSELPFLLVGDNGCRTASEASVVDSSNTRLVMNELFPDIRFRYEGRELGFLGDVILSSGIAIFSRVVMRRIHGRI